MQFSFLDQEQGAAGQYSTAMTNGASTTILAADITRKVVTITTTTAVNMFLSFGTAAALNTGFLLTGGQTLTLTAKDHGALCTGQINGFVASAGVTAIGVTVTQA